MGIRKCPERDFPTKGHRRCKERTVTLRELWASALGNFALKLDFSYLQITVFQGGKTSHRCRMSQLLRLDVVSELHSP